MVVSGCFGRVCTSDYVVDEAVTTALARTRSLEMSRRTEVYIIDSPRIVKFHVTEEVFQKSWTRFLGIEMPMSFTDVTTLVLMEAHGIEKLMSGSHHHGKSLSVQADY